MTVYFRGVAYPDWDSASAVMDLDAPALSTEELARVTALGLAIIDQEDSIVAAVEVEHLVEVLDSAVQAAVT